MCLGIPGQILHLDRDGATVAVLGARRHVDTTLVADVVGPGDWVLIHVGFAIARIDEDEARTTEALLDEAMAAEAIGTDRGAGR